MVFQSLREVRTLRSTPLFYIEIPSVQINLGHRECEFLVFSLHIFQHFDDFQQKRIRRICTFFFTKESRWEKNNVGTRNAGWAVLSLLLYCNRMVP